MIPHRYDDGNVSGATADRPALRRLLDDIDAGEVDCVLVYKIDRLSRSIADFVQMMDIFERKGVSFVSVTQQFDTSSSVGRLTLNLLTCFAQFERETIAERTRDKIHAARKRGRWTGGPPPLGYDVHPSGGRIEVNEAEAEQVRAIFELYVELGTLTATARTLNERGWTTKAWTTKAGKVREGRRWTKVSVRTLLTNVIYVGKVRLKDEVFDGQQDAIVEQALFERAEARLARNAAPGAGATCRGPGGALLAGLLRCEPCGEAMISTHTTRRGRRYHYYVCRRAQTEGWASCPTKSLPAHEIERIVVDQIRAIGKDDALAAQVIEAVHAQGAEVDEGDIRRALGLFEPVWEALHVTEQKRLLGLLIERAAYDREAGTVEVAFQATGIKALAQETDA